MEINEKEIGKNIREARTAAGLSQEKLAQKCGFSNSTLSAYETSKKIPNLITVAKIAGGLNTSIDRLCYGDENISFISQAPSEGRKIVNAFYFLWKNDVVYHDVNFRGMYSENYGEDEKIKQFNLLVIKHAGPIRSLISGLNDFRSREKMYDDPEKFLEMLLSSIAKEIDMEIEQEKTAETRRNNIRKDNGKRGPITAN